MDHLVECAARDLEPGDRIVNFNGTVALVSEAGTRIVYVEFRGAPGEDYVTGVMWKADREVVRAARPGEDRRSTTPGEADPGNRGRDGLTRDQRGPTS